jgi:hypothetical protein
MVEGNFFWHGIYDIKGVVRGCGVSLMGAFVEGVLHLRFQCILFPSPFIAIN